MKTQTAFKHRTRVHVSYVPALAARIPEKHKGNRVETVLETVARVRGRSARILVKDSFPCSARRPSSFVFAMAPMNASDHCEFKLRTSSMVRAKEDCLGKRIERNLVDSLRTCGADLKTSADLDHNRKIDFIVCLKGQVVGVQVSLMKDAIKAKVAKICALDVVPRFIYLNIAKEFFARPNVNNGKALHRLLEQIVETYSHQAMLFSIDRMGRMKVDEL